MKNKCILYENLIIFNYISMDNGINSIWGISTNGNLSAMIKSLNGILIDASSKNISNSERVELYKKYKYYSKITNELLETLKNKTQTATKPKMTISDIEQNIQLMKSDICKVDVMVDIVTKLKDEVSVLERESRIYENVDGEMLNINEDGAIDDF